MENDLLNAQEVAAILKISRNTVYELVKRRELAATKIGKQMRFQRTDVEKYVNGDKLLNSNNSAETSPTVPIDRFLSKISPETKAAENQFVIAGQDVCLDILANLLSSVSEMQVYRAYKGSYNGVFALYQGQVDLATAHLWDGDTGQYNVTYIKKMMPGIPTLMMRIVKRKQGFILKKGNPKKIQSWDDLKRADITIVNREPGSGTRVLLDEKLRLMGIIGEYIPGYHNVMKSGYAVASMVLNGEADIGIGSNSAIANLNDIDFIELQDECLDLIVRLADAEKEPFRKVLEVVSSQQFKRQLQSLHGYDTSETGKLILG